MHERNIYLHPPNFAELAEKYSFLAPYVTQCSNGWGKLDFKSEDALKALCRALLLHDFDLEIQFPENTLVPTVPSRLNYILWLEDLLTLNSVNPTAYESVRGLDIGTGSTAIYGLLGAKKNSWMMTGTEINSEAVEFARGNIQNNNLSSKVTVKHVDENTPFGEISEDEYYDFCMCNPPFFKNDKDSDSMFKSRKIDRTSPSGVKTGQVRELVTSGGEVEFISKLISESVKYQHQFRFFTTMVGIKSNLKLLLSRLKEIKAIQSIATTEFIQGKTTRWGLAWTFNPTTVLIHLNEPDIRIAFPQFPPHINLESYITDLFCKDLSCQLQKLDCSLPFTLFQIIAYENTWSHQRRKRRKQQNELKYKRPRIDNEAELNSNQAEQSVAKSPVLTFYVQLEHRNEDALALLAFWVKSGPLGKDGLNQIAQYLKNKYAVLE